MEGIAVKNIHKVFHQNKKNEVHVIKGISFEIKKGEFVAIVGKSGSGKSTLLHILGCLDSATTGQYVLDGMKIETLNARQRAGLRNEKIGFILQDFGLIPEETVLESVMLPMMFDDTRMSEMRKRAEVKIREMGLESLTHEKVFTLSGGEKQRTAIARALVKEPDYILADEPTGALDSENADVFMEQMRKLHKMGKTIVMVTHDLELAGCCDRIIRLKDGLIERDVPV